MDRVKRWLGKLDALFEYFGVSLLALMILIITWQVFSRSLLNSTPFWAAEVSSILLVWVGFVGIAVGFREGSHIAIEILVNKLPAGAQKWVERAIQGLVLAFGLYLLIEGAQFTVETSRATLPSTGWPRSFLYVMMPVAGFMICTYAALRALGVRTEKHGREEEHVE